jgi:hypothetical protein
VKKFREKAKRKEKTSETPPCVCILTDLCVFDHPTTLVVNRVKNVQYRIVCANKAPSENGKDQRTDLKENCK